MNSEFLLDAEIRRDRIPGRVLAKHLQAVSGSARRDGEGKLTGCQSMDPRGTIHACGCPVLAAMCSKSAS